MPQIENGQGLDVSVPQGQSIAIATVTGTYSATVISGTSAGTVLATASDAGGTFGPYASGATVRLSAGLNSCVAYEVGDAPVVGDAPPAKYALDPTTGNVTGLVGPDGGVVISNALMQRRMGAMGSSQNASQSINVCYNLLSNGTDTSKTFREPHVFPRGAFDVRLVYANLVTLASGQSTTGLGTVTITAAIEYGSSFYPVKFNNGQSSVAIPPGGYAVSDPIPVDITAGDTAWIRSCPTVSAGQKWNNTHYGMTTSTSSAANVDLTQATGELTTPGAGTHYQGQQFGPVAILGSTADTTSASVLVIGGSSVQGTGDGVPVRNVYHNGFVMRGLGLNSIYMAQAIPSSTAAVRIVQSNFPLFCNLWSNNDYVVCGIGSNDLAAGTTATVLAGYILTLAKWFKSRGIPFYQVTFQPKVSTTDFCATVANQTVISESENTQRITFNEWLRAGAPVDALLAPTTSALAVYVISDAAHPMSGVIDVADAVEVDATGVLTRNGGFWKCGGEKASGTATGYNNYVVTDSTKSWTINQWQGHVALLNGATPINIVSNTATTLTLGSSPATGSMPSNGSTPTYSIIETTNSGDGVHPGMAGHIAMSGPVAQWYASTVKGY